MPMRRDAMKQSMLAQRRIADINENPGQEHARAWNAAMRAGDFGAAWAVSDAVLATRDPATRDDPRQAYHERWVWDGRPFDGRRVVVRCYHGLGDTLQFCRFLPALRARAAHVTLEVQPELLPLLRANLDSLGGIDRLHPFDPAHPLPQAECDIEVMELCHALRQVPGALPYLHADPLPDAPSGLGLCWAASGWDTERNLDATVLRPLADVAPIISLQRGTATAGAAVLGATDPLHGSMDVVQTARLIAGLNAVVTVDTMAAHLAGALGRPTFVLLKHTPDWRWSEQCPPSCTSSCTSSCTPSCTWYASVRTVRQPSPGDWPGAVARLRPMIVGTLAGTGGL